MTILIFYTSWKEFFDTIIIIYVKICNKFIFKSNFIIIIIKNALCTCYYELVLLRNTIVFIKSAMHHETLPHFFSCIIYKNNILR